MKKVRYEIWKKTIGEPWPGEYWDDAKSLAEAKKMLSDGTYPREVFRIVKVTLESVALCSHL